MRRLIPIGVRLKLKLMQKVKLLTAELKFIVGPPLIKTFTEDFAMDQETAEKAISDEASGERKADKVSPTPNADKDEKNENDESGEILFGKRGDGRKQNNT